MITAGTFTSDARPGVTRDSAAVFGLIDGDQLCDQLTLGRKTEMVERMTVEVGRFDGLWISNTLLFRHSPFNERAHNYTGCRG